ncbi:MAG TPA: serine/threonine protein kinase, partial [Planctomycetes bacterium]|nr:serine/threonine protein kinase [Planctomycetota bacterium]
MPWFAMRRIQGESLEERLRRGPLSVEQVIDLGRQLCSALGAVHAAGLLHRDIKP